MNFALQNTAMTTVGGEQTHALYGFCTKLPIVDALAGYRTLVAFDRPEPTFAPRSSRVTRRTARRCRRLPAASGHHRGVRLRRTANPQPGFEADDVIASCVREATRGGASEIVIVGTDKDLLQLVTDDDADDDGTATPYAHARDGME